MNITRIYQLFPTESDCIRHLEKVRWKGKPCCPYCGSDRTTAAPEEQRHHCNNCNTTFSVTVGTIFHHTHLPLQKWLLAVSIVLNAKKGLSARQLARDLDVNRNTGWRMGMQIRKAMAEREQRELLTGVVEMDETYIGGKPRKGNTGSSGQGGGDKSQRGRGTKKTPVVGMLERGGRVRTQVVKKGDLTAKKLTALVRRNVDIENAILHTDEYKGYIRIKNFMEHRVVNHAREYVAPDGTHINALEGFWALVKRGIVGQYHHVTVRYLSRYLDEFGYRFDRREMDREHLFGATLERAVGAAS
ncbi:MAG: IS1595 family transposase [Xanthobacteraceae bacterium]